MPVAAPVGHPLAPFVVGQEGCGDDQDGQNGEENLHIWGITPIDLPFSAALRRIVVENRHDLHLTNLPIDTSRMDGQRWSPDFFDALAH